MVRTVLILSALALTACWCSKVERLPEPPSDKGMAASEAKLDHLTDKRDSRVAAAITVANGASTEDKVKAELSVAEAMLPSPTAADIAFAKERIAKGDTAFYAEQVAVSRRLAADIVEANRRYEDEKARKTAEYNAALKEREMALAAEQEARQADKWTYAGIGLTAIGLLGLFLSPLKLASAGVALTGLVVGAFPMLSKQPWFLPAVLGAVAVAGTIAIVLNRRKPSPDEPPQAQG